MLSPPKICSRLSTNTCTIKANTLVYHTRDDQALGPIQLAPRTSRPTEKPQFQQAPARFGLGYQEFFLPLLLFQGPPLFLSILGQEK